MAMTHRAWVNVLDVVANIQTVYFSENRIIQGEVITKQFHCSQRSQVMWLLAQLPQRIERSNVEQWQREEKGKSFVWQLNNHRRKQRSMTFLLHRFKK